MSIKDIRVKSIERRNIVGYAEVTIEAACLDPSPNLEAMKVRIESANEMEALLRKLHAKLRGGYAKDTGRGGPSYGVCAICQTQGYHIDGCAFLATESLLARIDAASEPRQPR